MRWYVLLPGALLLGAALFAVLWFVIWDSFRRRK